jgi:hypothetical protein
VNNFEQVKLQYYIGAFDGTGNVSGAVTLLNSAVIKVLTGYASGPGVVATDSILAST